MWQDTRVTRRLGIDYPIVQVPFLESHLLLVLQRRHACHRLEMLVERRPAHAQRPSLIRRREGEAVNAVG